VSYQKSETSIVPIFYERKSLSKAVFDILFSQKKSINSICRNSSNIYQQRALFLLSNLLLSSYFASELFDEMDLFSWLYQQTRILYSKEETDNNVKRCFTNRQQSIKFFSFIERG
jgi:hypothetical protein